MNALFQQDFHASATSAGEQIEAHDLYAVLLGMAGHDLRQPLQVLQSTYELLDAHVVIGAGRTQLARGRRAIVRLSKQLDHLVDAMRLQELTSDIVLAPVPLQPVLGAVVGDLLELAASRNIRLRLCPTSVVALSNQAALEGIIRNLVHNAIKYTPLGGSVLIGCRRRSDEVRIDVCDTGSGIAPGQVAKAFEPFHRLDASEGEGLGLGLHVVRRAAAVMRHRIEVCSLVGRGSRFSIVARTAGEHLPMRRKKCGLVSVSLPPTRTRMIKSVDC